VILVDTSVLVDYLRGKETPAVRRLDALDASEDAFGIPVPCMQEVLQGARDETEWRRLRAVLEVQELVAPADPAETNVKAARIYFDCRRKGLTVRSSNDCLIAQIALERGDELLHCDEDFETIRRVRPLRTLRE
jgi:predicted nucleic acid-binding protein